MRKLELLEMVVDYLNGGDAPDDMKGRFHDQIVKKYLEAAFNDIVFKVYVEGKNFADYSMLDSWAKNYTLDIQEALSATTGPPGTTAPPIIEGHVRLPYPPMQLPANKGILQVAPEGDLANAAAYRETNSNAVFAALEVGQISERMTFYLEQNATGEGTESHVLWLDNIPQDCEKVMVKIVVPLEKMDDFDEVAIPAGKEQLLIETVMQLLRDKPPMDDVNENRPAR